MKERSKLKKTLILCTLILVRFPPWLVGMIIFGLMTPFFYISWRKYKRIVSREMKRKSQLYGFDAAMAYRKALPLNFRQFLGEALRQGAL